MDKHGKLIYANKGKGKPDQDPTWYLKGSDAAKEAAQLGFTNATGAVVDVAGQDVETIPGLAVIGYYPTIGRLSSEVSSIVWRNNAFNKAFKRQYTQMRRKNTGSTVYGSTDLGVYTFCMANLYAYMAFCKRIIRLVNYYKNKNMYDFEVIAKAMRIDPKSVSDNLADFRIWVNNKCIEINQSLSAPNLPVFERYVWLNSHIWRDGDTVKSQLYIPQFTAFHKFNPTDSEAGSGTTIVELDDYISEDLATVENLKDMGNEMYDALSNDEDALLIAADIDKWYGGNQFILDTVKEEEMYEPEFSMEVLTQLQNIDVLPIVPQGLHTNGNDNVIYQTIGANLVESGLAQDLANHNFLTMPYDNPKPEEIVVASRNTLGVKGSTVSGNKRVISDLICGTELVHNIKIVSFDLDGEIIDYDYSGYVNQNGANETLFKTRLFDMFPKVRVGIVDSLEGGSNYVFCEFENYTPITSDRLDQIHRMSALSEFGFYDTSKSSSTY